MAICSWCKQDMMAKNTTTCTANKVVEFPDGQNFAAVPYENDDVEGNLGFEVDCLNVTLLDYKKRQSNNETFESV
jgi:hypothetical protein